MGYFIAVPSRIADAARSLWCQFNGKVTKNTPAPLAPFVRLLESPTASGVPIADDICIRMSADFPKADQPVPGASYYLLRQLQNVACLDEAKSKVIHFPSGGISDVERLVLDPKRIPKGVELFRPAEYPRVLGISEELARAFVDAGFVGLDYVRDTDWNDDGGFDDEVLFKGPKPASAPAKASGATKQQERVFPASLAPLVEKHHRTWIKLSKDPFLEVWIFDYRKLKADEKKVIEGQLRDLGGAAEDPDAMPCGVLHIYRNLVEELGRTPQTFKDVLGGPNCGFLMCDRGAVFHLDGGSRDDLVPSVAKLKFKPRT